MNNAIYFQITAENIKRAREFYSKVFGWKFTRVAGTEYHALASSLSGEEAAKESVNMGIINREGMLDDPVIVVSVSDIDEYAKRIEETGGSILIGKFKIRGVGWFVYFQDTEGNLIGLHKNV